MHVNKLVIPPKTLTFLTTFRCTATCKNCCFECNPNLTQRLTLDEMKEYVDQVLIYYAESLKVLVLTGGECFLLGEDLAKIIEYATSKNLITRVVTNGYWAKTYQKAYEILAELREKGLKEINFSTGDDHQQWVPYENIVNGCMASMDLGLLCIVNVETHDQSKFDANTFTEDYQLRPYFDSKKYDKPLRIDKGIWIPFDKETSVSYDTIEMKEDITHKRCTSLFNNIPINPYSNMSACCGLTSERIKSFRLGSVKLYSVKDMYESQFRDLLKIWLFVEGPYSVLRYIYGKRTIDKPIMGHTCYVCAEIFKDNDNIECIKDNYNEIMSSVMFKYELLKPTL